MNPLSPPPAELAPFGLRFERLQSAMRPAKCDSVMLTVDADLRWLCGVEAMPLERLTMLIVPQEGRASLVIPTLEAPRVVPQPEFEIVPWGETTDPLDLVIDRVGRTANVAIGDRTWARFVIDLMNRTSWQVRRASELMGPLRINKDESELAMLRLAGAAVDRIAARLQHGEITLIGRTEAEVAAEIGRQILDEGHQCVNFVIVAAGENAASPHHEPGNRVIGVDEGVLFDFGGTMVDPWGVGYCSDITRCVWTGEPTLEVAEIYSVLQQAQQAGVAASRVGMSCESVDHATREVIETAGYGEWFMHRTGHGIGIEEHEDPYIVQGNPQAIEPGHVFSIEPGIYLPQRLGFRLEDIVAAHAAGPESLNRVDHSLFSVG